jgi:hypothetical protein
MSTSTTCGRGLFEVASSSADNLHCPFDARKEGYRVQNKIWALCKAEPLHLAILRGDDGFNL